MSGPNGDPNLSIEESIINDEDEFGDEEYAAVNSMLDQINSYLDGLEEKNDALNSKLHELMESNRQARREFRSQIHGPSFPEPDSSSPKQEDDKDFNGSQTNDKRKDQAKWVDLTELLTVELNRTT